MDAALELFRDGAGKEFTVQEVVERSGQSLRSFYQYFEGKHELLLALFEESVASTVDYLQALVAEEADPLERLHIFVVEYHEICRPSPGGVGAAPGVMALMADFGFQLLTQYPKEAVRAFEALTTLFRQLLTEAVSAGVIRQDLAVDQVTGVVLEALMFNAFSSTIGGTTVWRADRSGAEAVWDIVLHGVAAP